jgi:hypothetical protein
LLHYWEWDTWRQIFASCAASCGPDERNTTHAVTDIIRRWLRQRWEAFLHHWVWDTWRRYFRMRGIVPKPPFCDPYRHYIFAHFPHAVFPMGSWLSFPLCGVPMTGERSLVISGL